MSKDYIGSNGFNDEPIVTKEKVYAFVALLVILAIAFVLFPNTSKNTLSKKTDENQKLVDLDSYNPIINSSNDTDGDGIPNWQEQIYGTNPNVPDAEKLPSRLSVGASANAVSSTTNLTELVARDMYVGGQYVKDGDGKVAPSVIANAISSSVKNVVSDMPAPNFKTINDNSASSLKSYTNDIGGVFIYIMSTNQKELDVLLNHLEKGGPLDYVSGLIPTFTRACKYLNDYPKVPSDQLDLHTRLTKTCKVYVTILNSFITADNDPVRAAASITLYKSNLGQLYSNFIEYKKIIDNNHIVYKSNEYGYIFTAIKL